jgi:hypothetical protein
MFSMVAAIGLKFGLWIIRPSKLGLRRQPFEKGVTMGKSEESNAQALLAVNLDQMLLPELDYLMIEMIETAQALSAPPPGGVSSDSARENRSRLKDQLLEKMRVTATSVHRARQSQHEMERASQRGVLSDWAKL